MKFRGIFEALDRNTDGEGITEYIQGGSPTDSPLMREALGDDPLQVLEDKESASKAELEENPSNAFVRQKWLYYASLLRDFKYTHSRRRRIKAIGLNGLYMECYGGAKIAVDSKHSE